MSSGQDRLPWEYASGPEVGEDVPITSEPREEEPPGVPRPPSSDGESASTNGEQRPDGTASDDSEAKRADV